MANCTATNGFKDYQFVYAFRDIGEGIQLISSSADKMVIEIVGRVGVVRYELTGVDLGLTPASVYWPTTGMITGLKIVHPPATPGADNSMFEITGLRMAADTTFLRVIQGNNDDDASDSFFELATNAFVGGDDIWQVERGSFAIGGNGDDLFHLMDSGIGQTWSIQPGNGNDTVDLSALHGVNMDYGSESRNLIAFEVENIIGSAHDDILLVSPDWDETNEIYVYLAGDYIDGGSGDDNIRGSVASDHLFGSKGNDVIYGFAAVPGAIGEWTGEAGGDYLNGGSGNDVLYGSDYDDQLFGSQGRDLLYGGAGDDMIDGGSGSDRSTGGRGADLFVYRSVEDSLTARRDIILDFNQAEGDRIDLSAMDADTGLSGNQSFTYIGTNAFSGEAGEFRVSYRSGGFAVLTGDVNGDGIEDFNIRVNDMSLSQPFLESDFLL